MSALPKQLGFLPELLCVLWIPASDVGHGADIQTTYLRRDSVSHHTEEVLILGEDVWRFANVSVSIPLMIMLLKGAVMGSAGSGNPPLEPQASWSAAVQWALWWSKAFLHFLK